jgi:uncharacterized protein (DUF433 family)
MKTATIEIIDRGRGPQLSTSRITVQDLVPYLLDNASYSDIREAMPSLSIEEIQLVEAYIRQHSAEVMEQDRRIRERAAARRGTDEEIEKERAQRQARLAKYRQEIKHKRRERNGD